MSFKLLAIRPLKGCSKDVLKNLKVDEFYFFDNSYERYKKSDYIVKKKDATDLPNDFFLQQNTESSLKYINVQAIVGMNGSGKSALVELLLRMLNNLFWFNSEKTKESRKKLNLIRAKGINGSLFFLYQGKINVITLISDAFPLDITWYDLDALRNVTPEQKNVLSQKIRKRSLKSKGYNKLHNIFFTMYINYSLYGLDELDFMKEGRGKDDDGNNISWLSRIFHKNDGYQTPLVIHPYREYSMINVRNEKYLMNQRLMSLLFTNDKYKDSVLGYSIEKIKINKRDNQLDSIVSEIISINTYSDIYNKTLRKGTYSFNFDRHYAIDKLLKEKPSENVSYISVWYDYILKNECFFSVIKEKYEEKEDEKLASKMPEVESYIYFIFLTKSSLEVQNKVINAGEEIKLKDITVPTTDRYKHLSNIEIQEVLRKIPMDSKMREVLEEEFESDLSEDIIRLKYLHKYLGYLFLDTFFKLIEYCTAYNFLITKLNKSNEEGFYLKNIDGNILRERLFWYIVKKSISIRKYKKFNYTPFNISSNNLFSSCIEEKFDFDFSLKSYLNKVYDENSHITMKLTQCYELLNIFLSKPNSKIEEKYISVFENTNVVYDISKLGEELLDFATSNEVKLINVLPPSIFEYDFLLQKKNEENLPNGKGDIEIHKLSSGQYQKLGLLSSIVYHLRNLDSVKEEKINNDIVYSKFENVNVILDEIELYFHPEQQRIFVNDLLVFIKKNKFEQIKNINLMFITHSPFILSDIPSQNVLKMKEGKPEAGANINSFGANIHDLLADEFFLKEDGFMGEFAKEKINSVVKFLYLKKSVNELDSNMSNTFFSETMQETFKEAKEKLSKELDVLDVKYSKEEVEQHIKLIGEPLLAVKMKEMSDIAFKEN